MNGFRRGQGAVIAQAVFGLGAGMGGGNFRHQRARTELAAQQGYVIAQQFGECLLRAAHVALTAGGADAALGHFLGGEHNCLVTVINKQQ